MAMVDIDEQMVQENFCEACDGYGINCTNWCDGFKIAYLMCELGLDEDWDWTMPTGYQKEKELLAALRLVKKTLVDAAERLDTQTEQLKRSEK